MKKRCAWVPDSDPLYCKYHDEEWGVPIYDEYKLFEFLILEGFQAGLSWATVLHKRESFRKAFDNFDPEVISEYDEKKIDSLLSDASIIRNRLKIRGSVINAKAYLKIQQEYGCFKSYIWTFVDNNPIQNNWNSIADIPASTSLSDRISKDLKKRGFTFVGSTIIYAHMQATGMVNDHTTDCFRHKELAETEELI
jgi:DNA-3-methyladenine glycosylase I